MGKMINDESYLVHIIERIDLYIAYIHKIIRFSGTQSKALLLFPHCLIDLIHFSNSST